jgi:hypothetical protein
MEKAKEERGQADEMAGAVFEFFASLLPQVMNDMSQSSSSVQGGDTDPRPDLMPEMVLPDTVIPTPDSITVTTVFGVHEEPSNVTVISASGPPPTHVAHELGQPEDAVMDTANEHLEQVTIATTAEEHDDFPVVVDEDLNDDGDDGDIDTDDFDAESALIDEFIDDGALTPTTTTTASIL